MDPFTREGMMHHPEHPLPCVLVPTCIYFIYSNYSSYDTH